MRQSAGFTIIELLVAGAILLVLLGSLGGIMISTQRAYRANQSVTTASGQLRSALQSIEYDVSLAGFCGVESECSIANAFGLELSGGGVVRTIETIESNYRETRYSNSTAPQRVTYRVADNQLLRGVDGSEPVAIANDIVSLELLGYRSSEDMPSQLRFNRPADSNLAGVDLRLGYLRGGNLVTEDFTITFQNRL